MEYRTVSAKLPSDELTLFRAHCQKKGIAPACLIRQLILREMKIAVPHIVAGKNRISYNKDHDSFTWSVELDAGKNVEVIKNISTAFFENLLHTITIGLDERSTFIQKTRKDSVPVPSDFLGGQK